MATLNEATGTTYIDRAGDNYLERPKAVMTNLEWIRTLDAQQIANMVLEAQKNCGYPWCVDVSAHDCAHTACDKCMMRWLEAEHDER